MLIPLRNNVSEANGKAILIPIKRKPKKTKNDKTLIEQAENFATIIASVVDGGAPADI